MPDPVTLPVTQQPSPKTHLPALDHAQKARAILSDRAVRLADTTSTTAQVLLSGRGAEAMKETRDLQRAAWRRYAALQKNWAAQWAGWFDYADRIKGANTMSKLVEMESNILAQAAELLGTQITSLVTLQENIEVDYTYLMKQILAGK